MPQTLARIPEIKRIVGLSDGQTREGFVPCTHHSGWFNERGEWIGWGDLTREDMSSIARALKDNERFIVLHEEDSYRRFLKCSLPDFRDMPRNEDAPGLDYIAMHAIFIIERRHIYIVSNVQPKRGVESGGWGVRSQFIDTATARDKILESQLEAVC